MSPQKKNLLLLAVGALLVAFNIYEMFTGSFFHYTNTIDNYGSGNSAGPITLIVGVVLLVVAIKGLVFKRRSEES